MNVAQLKRQGFSVLPAINAIGCTEVRCPSPFFYFNPKFFTDVDDTPERVIAADKTDVDDYQLIVAGLFSESDIFPFALITPEQAGRLTKAYAEHAAAKESLSQAHRAMDAAQALFLKQVAALVD